MCLPLVNVKNEDKSVSAKFVVDLGDNFSKNFATTKKKKEDWCWKRFIRTQC